MLVCYFVPLPLILARRHSRVIPFSSLSNSSPSESATTSAVLFLAPSKSRPACFYHLRDTLTPSLQADQSQRSRIGRVAIYCVTVFYLLVMYFPIPSKPDCTIASSNGGY